jgi:hypothetical protein
MPTTVFHEVRICGWSFRAVLQFDKIILFITDDLQVIEYPLNDQTEIVVAKDEMGQDRLAISNPSVAAKFFLTYFSAEQIAAIRRNFGIALIQEIEPSMTVNIFSASLACTALRRVQTQSSASASHRPVQDGNPTPKSGRSVFRQGLATVH